MSSFLTVKEGIYNPTLRFAFTNIDTESYELKWDGKVLVTIKPGESVELPHHLAVMATGELVDRIMIRETKEDELAHMNVIQNGLPYRSPKGIAMGVPAARKPFEDKILKELPIDKASSQFKILQSQLIDELKADLTAESAKPISTISVKPTEFAEINKSGTSGN